MHCPCKHKHALPPCKQAGLWLGCAVSRSSESRRGFGECVRRAASAALGCLAVRLALLAACVALVAFLAGCRTGAAPVRVKIDARPVVVAHEKKDTVILESAAQIDALAPEAKPHTDAQRAAVAAAPASDIAALVARYESQARESEAKAKADAAAIAQLRGQLDAANSRTDQVVRLGLAGFGALLIAGAVVVAVMAAKAGGIFVGVGPMQAGAIGAAGCVMLFASFAYGWATRNQSLVMGIFAALLVAAGALWFSNRRHAATSHLHA